ncbi:MAG: hypothetical protein AAFX53_16510 [Bacteroidota bacterium]
MSNRKWNTGGNGTFYSKIPLSQLLALTAVHRKEPIKFEVMYIKNHILFFEKFSFFLSIIAGVVVGNLLISCSEEGEGPDCSLQGTNLSISDISGNWNANSAVFGLAADGPVGEIDVVADGGSVTLNIQSGGRFTLNISQPGEPSDISPGSLCFDEDLLVVNFDEDGPDEYEFFGIQFNSSTNTLTIEGPTTFDFDGDGQLEPVRVLLVLTRS